MLIHHSTKRFQIKFLNFATYERKQISVNINSFNNFNLVGMYKLCIQKSEYMYIVHKSYT